MKDDAGKDDDDEDNDDEDDNDDDDVYDNEPNSLIQLGRTPCSPLQSD